MTYPEGPETGGRPLAEILREAGIDMSKAARRRKWNDPGWEDPVPQRRNEPDHLTDDDTGSHDLRRRRSDRRQRNHSVASQHTARRNEERSVSHREHI